MHKFELHLSLYIQKIPSKHSWRVSLDLKVSACTWVFQVAKEKCKCDFVLMQLLKWMELLKDRNQPICFDIFLDFIESDDEYDMEM